MNRFQQIGTSTSPAADTREGVSTTGLPSQYNSPPIYVEIASPQKHAFDWRDFDIRMLRQLQEPGVWYKADLDLELKHVRDGVAKTNNARRLPPDWLLFQCLENALKVWKPPFACVDEVHIILKMATTAATFEDQMDVFKSIANLSKVTHLLSGTYKIKDLIYEGDETTRRSRAVHFGRYLNSGDDFDNFQDFLVALTENSPIQLDFDPLQHLRFFYSSCVGCGGTLKDWFSASNCVAMLDERKRVHIDDFKATALDRKQLVKLIKEINAFERYFAACPNAEIIDAFWSAGDNSMPDAEEGKAKAPHTAMSNKRRRQKPGDMNPTRIPLDEDQIDDNPQDS